MKQLLQKFDATLGAFIEDSAKPIFFVFAAVALFICLAYQLAAVTYRYSLDYGEPAMVDLAMRIAAGENIYRADLSTPPYIITNYPPLYLAVVAISVKLFDPAVSFTVGRIISILSTWLSALFLGLIIYTPTRDRLAGLIAGVVFIAFPFVIYWSPLVRIDMFALVLSLAGLYLLISEPVSTRRFIAAALLLVAAIYTRQSYALAAPLAAFVWLLGRDWRRALGLAAVVGGVSLVLFLIFNFLTHGGFFFNIVTANLGEFGMFRLQYNVENFRRAALIPLLTGVFSFFLIRRSNPLWMLIIPYLIGSTLSAITIGKVGSNVNYFLELCAALSLATGVVIAWSRANVNILILRGLFLIAVVAGIGQMTRIMLNDYTNDLRERRTHINEISQLETLVAETPGPILTDEYMGMLTLQNRLLIIQPFAMTQLALAGKWDQTPFLNSINNHEYPLIILYDVPWLKDRWTPEMLNAINHSYQLVDIIAGNKIYRPGQPTTATTLSTCPGAIWQLPGDGTRGVQWNNGGLDFYGQGQDGKIPVYAVADGLLTRRADWFDAVIIQHDDPLHPGTKLWSYYSGMGAANGADSFVAADFPPGAENVPVKAGQIIGYQGTWSGKPLWASWVHVHFAILNGSDPTQAKVLDLSSYLNLALATDNQNQQDLKCRQP